MKNVYKFLFLFILLFSSIPVLADSTYEGYCTCSTSSRKFQVDCGKSQKSCQAICSENNASVSNNQCKLVETSNTTNNSSTGNTEAIDCSAISDITKPLTQIIMIAGPIILIIMGTVDIMGVVASGDDKGMKKAWNNLLKRFLICLVLLLLPTIVNIIVGITSFNDLTACLK